MRACQGCGAALPPQSNWRRTSCGKECSNTIWRPGLLVGTYSPGGSDDAGAAVMLIQRAPADDGWLAVSQDGVIYNIFDSIARIYYPLEYQKRYLHVLAAMNPREWFGMRRVRLNLKPIGGR